MASDTYDVTFRLDDGTERTVTVFGKGPVSAELNGRRRLVEITAPNAFTARVAQIRRISDGED
jgi:hypothetical protein